MLAAKGHQPSRRPWRRRVSPLVVGAGLLAATFAGCLSGIVPSAIPHPSTSLLSAPTLNLTEGREIFLTMKDGVKIDNWVFRPAENGTYPVIIESRPYFGNLDPPASDWGQKFSHWLITTFVPRGYVVVLNSVRGTGNSGGCYGQGGVTEQQDLATVVEDFAAMNYSNGKVALIGKSYGGTTPWEADVAEPPHLATIVPIEGITSWYDYLFTNGVPLDGGALFNTEYPVTISDSPYVGSLDPTSPPRLSPTYAAKFCKDTVDLASQGFGTGASGDETAWWQERDYTAQIAKINQAHASVYIIHGLQDWNVKPDQATDIFNLLTVPKHMLLGQQDHQYPLRTDWGTELLRWFDFWLKGIPNGIMDEPPVVVMDNTGVWHFEKDFPPSNATRVSYVLGADGSMAADCGGGSQGNGAVGCSAGSLPYLATGITRANDPTPGPDKVIFTTAPASRTIHISGVPTLTFNATIQGADTQFIATLYDVNGTKWTPLDWAALDARHRSGPNGSEDVPAGQAVAYRLSFFPMDYAWAAGHRLALTVAGSGGFWLQTPGGFSPVAVPVATSAGLGLSPGPTEARVVITTGAGSAFTIPTQPGLLAERPQPAMAAPADLPWTS